MEVINISIKKSAREAEETFSETFATWEIQAFTRKSFEMSSLSCFYESSALILQFVVPEIIFVFEEPRVHVTFS